MPLLEIASIWSIFLSWMDIKNVTDLAKISLNSDNYLSQIYYIEDIKWGSQFILFNWFNKSGNEATQIKHSFYHIPILLSGVLFFFHITDMTEKIIEVAALWKHRFVYKTVPTTFPHYRLLGLSSTGRSINTLT